jgi:hypothetical protein
MPAVQSAFDAARLGQIDIRVWATEKDDDLKCCSIAAPHMAAS